MEVVLVFPPLDEDDKYMVMPFFWIPEDSLDLRVRRDHVPYDVREKQGFPETAEGNVIHYGLIEKFIEKLGERFNIQEIAFDRWHPVWSWMMDNVYIRTDPAGNIRMDKQKSTEKIDGAVALVMALDRVIRCGNTVTESVYDDRGILLL